MATWKCLTEIDLNRIYSGRTKPEELQHLFICTACRCRLQILAEAMRDAQIVETDVVQSIAAMGYETAVVKSLCTADESLICRLERTSEKLLRVSVLADRKTWGDTVVIWPVSAPAFLIPVGQSVTIPETLLSTIPLWQVSHSEISWSGDVEGIPDEITGTHGAMIIERRGDSLAFSTSTSVLSAAAICLENRPWEMLNLPATRRLTGRISLSFFTALTAVPLS